MKRRRFAIVSVLAAALFEAIPPLYATTGTLVITSDTTLTQDHYGSVVVAADNVVLDAAGHTIFGPGGPETDGGIDVGNLSGVTVKNATVTGFVHGIKIVNSSQVTVTDTRAYGNSNGFYIIGTSNSHFAGNTASDNFVHGFDLAASDRNGVIGNLVTGNSVGIGIAGSENSVLNNTARGNGHGMAATGRWNRFEENALLENSATGLTLDVTEDCIVIANTASDSGWSGFAFHNSRRSAMARNNALNNSEQGFLFIGGGENVLTTNTASRNGFEGFLFVDSDDNRVTASLANHNGDLKLNVFAGFALVQGSSGNLLDANTATRNGDEGFILEASDNNIVTNNIANANRAVSTILRQRRFSNLL
jgi:parallel beta-helix repeat protein